MMEVTPGRSFPEEPKFPLGRTAATRAVLTKVTHEAMYEALSRHERGDWGEVCKEDAQANERALKEGQRLVSVYRDQHGTKFYIITEWDRSQTTMLLPEDY